MFNTNQIITIINSFLKIFSKKTRHFTLLDHNGIKIEDYPETDWYLVPFPKQKGFPYNSDNLATVNRYKFLENEKFKKALKISENRWSGNHSNKVRDISWRLHIMLWTVFLALKDIDSENEIFVECGTGKGYMAAGICDYFNWNQDNPHFYLIDSFKSTMPEIDGSQIETGKKLFAYTDDDFEVRNYFSIYSRVEIIKGLVPAILNELPKEKFIKFLHLDLNNHIAEEKALEVLTKNFKTGSIILFDDYGGPGADQQAKVHELFASKNNKSLLCLPTGQALIIW